MKRNMSNIDRIVRILFAVIVAALYFGNVISGTLALVLAVVGGILLLTGLVNFCPLYAVFGISTCKVPKS
jgi:hypothetical protein